MRNYHDRKEACVTEAQNEKLFRAVLDVNQGKRMENPVMEFGKF